MSSVCTPPPVVVVTCGDAQGSNGPLSSEQVNVAGSSAVNVTVTWDVTAGLIHGELGSLSVIVVGAVVSIRHENSVGTDCTTSPLP